MSIMTLGEPRFAFPRRHTVSDRARVSSHLIRDPDVPPTDELLFELAGPRDRLFFDPKLSDPEGQSCAACHGPEVGFTGPDEELNKAGAVYEGAERGRFGNRKPPASSYGGDSPVLYFDKKEKTWVGGMFWDGRATGSRLKDPLAEQAQGPFLNPLEQNIPDIKTVCIKIKNSTYAALFEKVWGKGSLDCEKNVSGTYDRRSPTAMSIPEYIICDGVRISDVADSF